MKGIFLTAVLAASALAIPANAQFGGVVFDPAQSAHAAQQLIQGSELYTTTIKTLTNVMLTYNLAHRMATAPSSYYTAYTNMGVQMWTQVTRPANTYGNSLPWMNAATTGNGAAAAYQSASVPRTGQISGYSALNSQGQQAVAAQGATVDLGDAVNATSLQTLGTIRVERCAARDRHHDARSSQPLQRSNPTDRTCDVAAHQSGTLDSTPHPARGEPNGAVPGLATDGAAEAAARRAEAVVASG